MSNQKMAKSKTNQDFLAQLECGFRKFVSKADELVSSDGNYGIMNAIADIKENLLGWVKSGLLLGSIKKEFVHIVLKNKLAKNWAEFCQKFFNQSHWYTDRLIKSMDLV